MCIRGGRGGPGAGAAEGYTPVTFLAPSRAGPPDLNIRTPIASPPPRPPPQCWDYPLHSGSSLAIIIFFKLFFSSYILILTYLMTFLREKNIFLIKWGILVHREV
jgi:hypothetical protein